MKCYKQAEYLGIGSAHICCLERGHAGPHKCECGEEFQVMDAPEKREEVGNEKRT